VRFLSNTIHQIYRGRSLSPHQTVLLDSGRKLPVMNQLTQPGRIIRTCKANKMSIEAKYLDVHLLIDRYHTTFQHACNPLTFGFIISIYPSSQPKPASIEDRHNIIHIVITDYTHYGRE
jgi:hypothetical protein